MRFYLIFIAFLSVSIFAMDEDHFSVHYLTRFNLNSNDVKEVEKISNSLCFIYFKTEAAANLFYETIKNAGYRCTYFDFLKKVALFKKDGVLEIVKRMDNSIVNDTRKEKVLQREAAPLKRNLEHQNLTPTDVKDNGSNLRSISYSDAKESDIFKNMFYSTHYGEPGSWLMGTFAFQEGSDFNLFKARFPKKDYRIVEPEPTIIRMYSTEGYFMQVSIIQDYYCPLKADDTCYKAGNSEFWVGLPNQKLGRVNEREFEVFKSNFSKIALESFDKACRNI